MRIADLSHSDSYICVLRLGTRSKMASSVVKQELPPKGGYPPIEYARNLPKRGPSGMMMFIGGAAVMAFGFYHVIMGNRKRW